VLRIRSFPRPSVRGEENRVNSMSKKTIDRTKWPGPRELPLRRRTGLIIQEIENELLIYDQERDRSHCLNWTAMLIWEVCDGRTSKSEMCRVLSQALQSPVSEGFVLYGLRELARNHLLEKPSQVSAAVTAGMTRRQIMRAMGLATVIALPLVTSIVVPTPAQAATCFPSGAACSTGAQCCPPGICQGNGTCL